MLLVPSRVTTSLSPTAVVEQRRRKGTGQKSIRKLSGSLNYNGWSKRPSNHTRMQERTHTRAHTHLLIRLFCLFVFSGKECLQLLNWKVSLVRHLTFSWQPWGISKQRKRWGNQQCYIRGVVKCVCACLHRQNGMTVWRKLLTRYAQRSILVQALPVFLCHTLLHFFPLNPLCTHLFSSFSSDWSSEHSSSSRH